MTHTEAVSSLAVERYLLDEMTEPDRDAFEAHFFDCKECAGEVKAGALMRDGVKAGLLASPQVDRIATFTPARKGTVVAWYRSSVLPWAVAATLAVTVGYQSRQPFSGVGSRSEPPEALVAVMLRPASRGAVPTVSVAAPHVALALDVDAGGAAEMSYELRAEGGGIAASGRAPAPAKDSPLLLVIPTFTLKPDQQYILAVREAASPSRTLGEYRFAATP